jgi:putative DNA primase/helicase
MVSLAQSEAGIPVRVEDLDADLMKFNVTNGTVDLITGELLPHNHRDKITKLAPVTYDPDAKAPAWDAFLKEIFAGNENMIRFLQRAVGYTLTGSVAEQILLLLWGTGANGKTTFLEVLRFIFGDYALAAAFTTFTLQGDGVRNDIARLKSARLVSANEGSDGQRLDEALVKQLTGGDTIAARHLYAEHFEFKPTFKIWLASNHKPRIKETGIAVWRRVKLIPFTVTIPEPEQDKGLIDKLLAEAPGILNWAIKGCLQWRLHGLGVPDEVKAATRQYQDEEDPVTPFLAECCMIGPREEVTLKAMYERYRVWCEAGGERELKKRNFNKLLEEKGFDSYRGAKGAWTWMGVRLEL